MSPRARRRQRHRVGDRHRWRRQEHVEVPRSAGNAVPAGRDHGAPRSDIHEGRSCGARRAATTAPSRSSRSTTSPVPSGDRDIPSASSACSASTRLGLTRSAPAAAASISRSRHVDGDHAAVLMDDLDQPAMGTLGSARRRAPADRHDVTAAEGCPHRGDDLAPLGVAQGWTRLVDHRGATVRLDHHRRAAESPLTGTGRRAPFSFEQLDGEAAEAAGEGPTSRAGAPRVSAARQTFTALPPGVIALRWPGARSRQRAREADRAVDRLVEADHDHRRASLLLAFPGHAGRYFVPRNSQVTRLTAAQAVTSFPVHAGRDLWGSHDVPFDIDVRV